LHLMQLLERAAWAVIGAMDFRPVSV
jgi:hypothetical protein